MASEDVGERLERLVRRAVWNVENGRPVEGAKALRRLRADLDMACLVSRTAGEGEPGNLLRLKADINHTLELLSGGQDQNGT